MRYHEISKTPTELQLDYKAPWWFIPALIFVPLIILGYAGVATYLGKGNLIIWVICIVITIGYLFMLKSYKHSRPITIDYTNKTMKIDDKVIPFADIKDVEAMNHHTFANNGYVDSNFPYKFAVGKREMTTHYAVIITNTDVYRVSVGESISSKNQAKKFKEYLNLK